MERVSAGHYLIGMEGLALLRTWLVARDAADRRIEEIARVVAQPAAPPLAIELDVPEEDVQSGYARWAANYDLIPNALIRLEEPVVRGLIDRSPPGVALDAACGTGRHTRWLHARGHRVIGVDTSGAMLARARTAVPDVELRTGDLLALPVETGSVDLAVCALALSHCPRLEAPIAELARVVRPGGRVILSDLHPFLTAIGVTAFFVADDGRAGQVRSYHHPHATYLAAFRAAGLTVLDCMEPVHAEEDLAALSGGMLDLAPDAFRDALLGLPGALVWELARRG